jgi:hypothetical protein
MRSTSCLSSFHETMSDVTKKKKQRTGANTLLLAQNEREGVAICSEPRRRRDAPANDAAEGEPSSSGGKGRGKGKASTAAGKSVDIGDPPVSNNDFISKLLSASVDGLGNLQVVGCSSHSYGAPPAPPPKIMHDTELGLSLYSDCDMDSKTYVNVTGPGARISQAVEKVAKEHVRKEQLRFGVVCLFPGQVSNYRRGNIYD